MASPASSAWYENQDYFLLERFIHELELPVKIEEASMSDTASITYKSRIYVEELRARGIVASEESPEGLEDILQRLHVKSDNSKRLTTEETDAFQKILTGPANEPIIQALVVPPLLDLIAATRSPLINMAVGAEFVAGCSVPLHRDRSRFTKISTPWPDITIGLRRECFKKYEGRLWDLGDIVAPISCTTKTIFPCFTVEIKGPGGNERDAIKQNLHNAAIMLQNFRKLSILARGDEVTQATFDGVPRVLSATMTCAKIKISVHWTGCKENGNVMFMSREIKTFDIEKATNEPWNNAATFLRNAMELTAERTNREVLDVLERLHTSFTQSAPVTPTRPPKRKHEVLE